MMLLTDVVWGLPFLMLMVLWVVQVAKTLLRMTACTIGFSRVWGNCNKCMTCLQTKTWLWGGAWSLIQLMSELEIGVEHNCGVKVAKTLERVDAAMCFCLPFSEFMYLAYAIIQTQL